jgi:membrane-associated protease RseP (regulator of RpoE activity)
LTLRGIIAGVFLLLATPIYASEYCELILKEDFRETSNIKLVYHDGGVSLQPNSPVIDKIRFGSPAARTNLRSGDRITSINNFTLPNDEEEAYQKLISILEPPGVRDVILEVTHLDETSESVRLSKNSYLGHPIVEIDILFNDLEITQQSSKSLLDLDIHLKWNNDRLIYLLSRRLEIPDRALNCQFQKSQELDNILEKIWYPHV